MTDQTLSQLLANFAATTTYESLPDDVRSSVKMRVLDIVGVSLAAVPLDTSRAIFDFVAEQGGTGRATAIGIAELVPAPLAAFTNGVLAHSLDYDDTHLPSVLHPSASVIPASLAAAQIACSTGEETIAAIAVGLEVTCRLGMAGYDSNSRDSLFFERGQHATSICGTIGSAVACAKLLGGDADAIAHAIGIAVSMGAGLLEGNRTGGTVKRIHCGIAAQSAVTAASLARLGITGPPTALEGRFGFFRAFLDGRFEPEALRDRLGTRWEVPRIFFKPYPSNHFTHAGIDAARAARAQGIDVTKIASIELGVPSNVVRTIGEPIDAKRAPASGYLAKFSGPYTVAAALVSNSGLGVSHEDFTDAAARDPFRRELAARVTVSADSRCDEIYPDQFPAVLRIRSEDGSLIEERVDVNLGGPQRPLSFEEIAMKFRDNASLVVSEDDFTRIEELAMHLEISESVDALLAPAARAK